MSPVCQELMEALGTELPPALAEHARTCEHCQAVVEMHRTLGALAGQRGGPVERPPTQALEEIAAHPLPRRWWTPAALLVVAEMAVVAVALLVLGQGHVVGNRGDPGAIIGVAVFVGLAMWVGAFAAFGRGGAGSRWSLAVATSLLAGGLAAAGSGWHADGPFSGGFSCLVVEVAVAAFPWVLALVLLKRTAYDPSRAWLAGLCGGAAGAFALHLHCSNGSPAHLLVFHALPWLALGGLAVVARRNLRSTTFAP